MGFTGSAMLDCRVILRLWWMALTSIFTRYFYPFSVVDIHHKNLIYLLFSCVYISIQWFLNSLICFVLSVKVLVYD